MTTHRMKCPHCGAQLILEDLPSKMTRREIVERVRSCSKRGLAFVPDVVRGVAGAREALLEAANAGVIELRPEGGINRLSAEEKALCLPGPQKSLLSWARVV